MSAAPDARWTRPLGSTGMAVSALGLGAGPLGDAALDDDDAERLVHAALDLGITLIDTAPSYGASEERVGRALRGKREGAIVCTKGGYGVPGVADWMPEGITRGIEQALVRLATDRVEVFFLHSCPRERLERGDLFAPLHAARDAGKVRAVGYSGDGDALDWAIRSGVFDVVECSVNLVDQRAMDRAIPEASSRGVGVVAKRALANAAWRADADGSRADIATYRDRLRAMWPEGASPAPEPAWDDLALRFALHVSGVASALVGTRSVDHLARAVDHAHRGPLPAPLVADLRSRFRLQGGAWKGVV